MSIVDWVPIQLYFERILEGIRQAIVITLGAVALGLVLGLVLAFARDSRRRWLSEAARISIDIGRSLPVLPLLYLVYFGILATGYPIPPEYAGIITLGVNLAFYMAELFRSGTRLTQGTSHELPLALRATRLRYGRVARSAASNPRRAQAKRV